MTITDASFSAFGDLITVQPTPVFQSDFVYGLNSQTWNTAATSGTDAAVTTDDSRLKVVSGTDDPSYAYLTSRKLLKYRAGSGMLSRFTGAWESAGTGSTQIMGIGSVDTNAPYDGYFFGYSGDEFGIHYYNRTNLTFIAQEDWNGDVLDGSGKSGFDADWTKGNVFQIVSPYLGYGAIRFYVLTNYGEWVLVHTIAYPNTSAETQLQNPSLQWIAFAANDGGDTSRIMYCGSIGVFITGQRGFGSSPLRAAVGTESGVTTEVNLLSIRNATTYNTVANRGLIKLHSISFASSQNNGTAVLRLRRGATLGGTTTFTPVSGTTANDGVAITSGQSIASVNQVATFSGGDIIHAVYVAQGGASELVNLSELDFFIAPGETLTITVESSTSSTIGVTASWVEEI